MAGSWPRFTRGSLLTFTSWDRSHEISSGRYSSRQNPSKLWASSLNKLLYQVNPLSRGSAFWGFDVTEIFDFFEGTLEIEFSQKVGGTEKYQK